ncbi:molybdate ABC transporter substrate-binding protein [Rhizobium rhizosphaerae]|uniref:Molybdate ABC transporter substrate-binding protein n=1 Tax=Xaviernesmea rhizosphaerae TaxID=1672749 RepID=A0ABX3PAI4_9HYPH|nr:molybdate ABC transporter substrate-binding protein [Xaviernesmea rhizosphaerae]
MQAPLHRQSEPRRRLAGLLAALVLIGGVLAALAPDAARAEAPVTVFAAASLKTALDAVNQAFTAETGKPATASYAASSALAKQIEAGAPADLFISADEDWMNDVAGKKLIRAETRTDLLGNRLVLVSAKAEGAPVEIGRDFDLKGKLGEGRLAMGAVESVPAGKYGKAALENLGLWDGVKDRVAGAENVRAALLLVSRGEAPFGIVYETDAAADKGVHLAGLFPAGSHPPIVYPAAILTDSHNPAAADYLAFLRSDKAGAIFKAQGFTLLSR